MGGAAQPHALRLNVARRRYGVSGAMAGHRRRTNINCVRVPQIADASTGRRFAFRVCALQRLVGHVYPAIGRNVIDVGQHPAHLRRDISYVS